MELTLLTNGYFFTTSFLSTQRGRGNQARIRGKALALRDLWAQNMELEKANCSYPVAASSRDLHADITVDEGFRSLTQTFSALARGQSRLTKVQPQ